MSPGPGAGYRGRFAPSPTGLLHEGSLVAALASWLDARAHGGRWLVRIEDVDTPRCVPGADQEILAQLDRLGLRPDEPPLWQSQRGERYAQALARLQAAGLAYGCACSRKDIAQALAAAGQGPERHGELVYPGSCRPARDGLGARAPRAWRLLTEGAGLIAWQDRRLGAQQQALEAEVGDFVLRRADGLWAYQLAVVVDDAEQGISDVVRGEDLADNTPRQRFLQRCLGLPTPRYLHTPLVLAADGQKLSKQNGARPLDLSEPVAALQRAAAALGLPPLPPGLPLAETLAQAVAAWRGLMMPATFEFPSSSQQDSKTIMHTTASGLQYEDTTPGTGPEAKSGQDVSVHYTGWLYKDGVKGQKFDSSKDRAEPFDFELDGGMVIRGWDEGVQGMKVGGTRVLVIPPELGYGARGAGGVIPPNATLMFEVELLGVSGGEEAVSLNLTSTASGLQFEDKVIGEGAEAKSGARVTVHYTGWLYKSEGGLRGKKFDSSKDRRDPFKFQLDAGMVIRGWDEGVQGMKVGGTRILVIPAELGYGARGAGGVIPPNATLMFEVELLAV